MSLELVVVLVIVVANVAFVAGCAWNSRAYERGYVDGLGDRVGSRVRS